MSTIVARLALAALSAIPIATVAHSQITSSENSDKVIAAAVEAAYREDWPKAERLAREFADPDALDLIAWWRLRAGDGSWPQYQGFLERNGDWPGLKRLRRRGEEHIPESADPRAVTRYFEKQLPQTGTGALRFATALRQLGRPDEARAEARRAWVELNMDRNVHDTFVSDFRDAISDLHVRRLDHLLWKGWIESARLMLGLVPSDWRALARTRIALKKKASGVDAMIRGLSNSLKSNGGLAYDRFIWRLNSGFDDSARKLILEVSRSAEALGRPEAWSYRRRVMARDAMEAGGERGSL